MTNNLAMLAGYYAFILNMWILRKIDEAKVQEYVTKGYITQEEANMILATPQIPV